MSIILILVLALGLRILSLNQSLWLDEATTALVAKMSISDFFTKFMPADFHPPLYYLIVHYWSILFGTSEVAIRMPSVIFGIGTVYVVYLIAKDLKYKYPAVPALFLATSGLHIYYSQEARMYCLVTLLVSYLVLTFIRKKWVIFSLVLSLIFLTDYLAILVLPALVIYTLIFEHKYLKKLLLSTIPLVILFLLWSPIFMQQLSNGIALKTSSSGWWNILGPVTFKNIALIPTKFMLGRISFDNKYLYFILVAITGSIFIYQIIKAKNKLVWSWFVISLILGIFVSFFIPTLTYFRYLFILPAFYLLIAEKTNKFIVCFIFFINLLTSSFYLLNPSFHRENWREIVKRVGQDKIVMPANSQKEALDYYGLTKNIIKKENLGEDKKQIWLSRYVWNIFDPDDSTRKIIEDLGYNWSEEVNLNGVVFWKYTK